ncbi:MAG: adenylate/guanylate cyclase domain-containing protein [Acidiferrobacterales bacterium]
MIVTSREQHCAILFADVVGSTRSFVELGDEKAKVWLLDIQRCMSEVVTNNSGEVLDYIGDEVMCRFPDADTAVSAACLIQRAMQEMPPTEGISAAARIGINWGSIVADGDRLFGDTINIASRLTEIAEAGQIIISDTIVSLLSADARSRVREFDHVKVKGKHDALSIYDVLWEQDGVTMIVSVDKTPLTDAKGDSMSLEYKQKVQEVGQSTVGFKIGRDDQSDLVVTSTLASRNHARIEFRRGKFVLIDQSTNGTYVKTNDGKVVYLRREELPLWGNGEIGLGEAASEDNLNLIRFSCP